MSTQLFLQKNQKFPTRKSGNYDLITERLLGITHENYSGICKSVVLGQIHLGDSLDVSIHPPF